MKRLWLTGVALTVLVAGPATAADMPVKAPLYRAPPPPLFYNWTGFYVGLNGGYAFGRESVDPNVVSGACDNPLGCPQILALLSGGQSINPSGFTGGLQIGYNLQFGNFLLGLESDIDYFRLNGSFAYGPTRPSAQPITGAGSGSVTTNWVATIRQRVGWVADRLLVYATGGVAFTDERNSESSIVVVAGQISGPIGTFNLSSSSNIGWVVGGGLEYAWTNQWSVRAEYLHFDFAKASAATGVIGGIGGFENAIMTSSWHLTADSVRAGINYKFDWGRPVYAAY